MSPSSCTIQTVNCWNKLCCQQSDSLIRKAGFEAAIFFCQVISEVAIRPFKKRVAYNHAYIIHLVYGLDGSS